MHRLNTGLRLFLLGAGAAVLALLLFGCKNGGGGKTGGQGPGKSGGQQASSQYPVDWDKRPYTKCHDSVQKAWFLTENAYFVVREKWVHSKGDVRKSVEGEIDHNLFGVNDEVKRLFEDGIKAEPENALNYASYAVWLKPRKYVSNEGTYNNAFPDAVKQIDKAIELWPDESRFYLIKAWIVYAPNYVGDWLRSTPDSDLQVNAAMSDLEGLFASAEKYDPDNANINYLHALTVYRYSDPTKFDDYKDTLLREIRAGNRKSRNYFFFPPPVKPANLEAQVALLQPTQVEAVYYDIWNQFGFFSPTSVRQMIDRLGQSLKWPDDKQDFAEVMYFAYSIGRALPYDRSYFHMQQRLLDQAMTSCADNPAERRKLAEVARYLGEQYHDAATDFYGKKLLKDSAHLDVSGIESVEQGGARQNNLKEELQPREAAYLKKVAEELKVEMPLPSDPAKW